jgi:hypothetical protein
MAYLLLCLLDREGSFSSLLFLVRTKEEFLIEAAPSTWEVF